MTFEEVMILTSHVSGATAFEDEECKLFFETISSLDSDSTIIEIGCQFGRSSSIILQVAPTEAEIHFIDPFESPEVASKWMFMARAIGRPFTLHCDYSKEIETIWFNLILIDGDHSKDAVEKDLKFLSQARKNAYACFHDYGRDSLPEVMPTVLEYMSQNTEWKFYKQAGTLAIWRKF